MKRFPWQKEKEWLTASEKEAVLQAIQQAEQRTSGEVRVFIESHCRYVDPIDRAQEVFFSLKMEVTQERNATLIYLAVRDRQAAVYGDIGIHQKVGQQYWEDELRKMMLYFRQEHLGAGIAQCVTDLGEALHYYFPFDRATDKNELPDDIVFGK